MENNPAAGTEAYPGPVGGLQITPLAQGQLPPTPADAQQPDPGKASISGTVFSFSSALIVPKTFFYLTHGLGPEQKEIPPAFLGPNPSVGDVSGGTDDNGQFQLKDVPPGNYYLVVSAPNTWLESFVSPTELKPKLFTLEADQKYPLGVVYVAWP